MKKNILIITTFITSCWVSGQNIFERYADNDKVTLVSISPKMFKILGQMSLSLDDPEAQEYMEMVKSINNFKVLVSSSEDISDDMLKWVNDQVSKENLDELMNIKDKDAVESLIELWSPYKSVASLLLWKSIEEKYYYS